MGPQVVPGLWPPSALMPAKLLARTCDVAIVGAGVAGLTAMRELENRGLRTQVIEARDRIGGRIYTVRDSRLAHPVELGAEFIHGSAPDTLEIVREAGLLACTIEGQRWRRRNDRLTRLDDFWARLHPVMRHLNAGGPDRSFADFLDDKPGGRSSADARTLARSFVEGFHAADARRISAKALADGGSPSEDPEEQRMMRIANGYDRVPAWLERGFADRIMTEAVVERIEWEPGGVELVVRQRGAGATTALSARAVIVTAPLGVLLAGKEEPGSIQFSPALPVLDGLDTHLAMGSVVRVVLLFGDRWWTKPVRSTPSDASLDSLSFLHGDAGDISIWWTLHPAHVPVLVGWAGGPAALRLVGCSPSEILDRAVAGVAANFGVSRRRIASRLEGCWTHDWQHDPFSRGAYSYALVGSAEWASRLARPMQRTVWLAGEAADAEGRNGTVHGAIGSGRRAARSVAKALS